MPERDPKLDPRREIFEAFDRIRASNDKIGAYSDHEGDENGSTCFFWRKGAKEFTRQVERAIADHEAAIKAWRNIAGLSVKYRSRKVGSDA